MWEGLARANDETRGTDLSPRERDPYLFRRARAPDQARMEMAPSTIFRYILVSRLSKMKIHNRPNSQNKWNNNKFDIDIEINNKETINNKYLLINLIYLMKIK